MGLMVLNIINVFSELLEACKNQKLRELEEIQNEMEGSLTKLLNHYDSSKRSLGHALQYADCVVAHCSPEEVCWCRLVLFGVQSLYQMTQVSVLEPVVTGRICQLITELDTEDKDTDTLLWDTDSLQVLINDH